MATVVQEARWVKPLGVRPVFWVAVAGVEVGHYPRPLGNQIAHEARILGGAVGKAQRGYVSHSLDLPDCRFDIRKPAIEIKHVFPKSSLIMCQSSWSAVYKPEVVPIKRGTAIQYIIVRHSQTHETHCESITLIELKLPKSFFTFAS
jgi:hypothetical protein